ALEADHIAGRERFRAGVAGDRREGDRGELQAGRHGGHHHVDGLGIGADEVAVDVELVGGTAGQVGIDLDCTAAAEAAVDGEHVVGGAVDHADDAVVGQRARSRAQGQHAEHRAHLDAAVAEHLDGAGIHEGIGGIGVTEVDRAVRQHQGTGVVEAVVAIAGVQRATGHHDGAGVADVVSTVAEAAATADDVPGTTGPVGEQVVAGAGLDVAVDGARVVDLVDLVVADDGERTAGRRAGLDRAAVVHAGGAIGRVQLHRYCDVVVVGRNRAAVGDGDVANAVGEQRFGRPGRIAGAGIDDAAIGHIDGDVAPQVHAIGATAHRLGPHVAGVVHRHAAGVGAGNGADGGVDGAAGQDAAAGRRVQRRRVVAGDLRTNGQVARLGEDVARVVDGRVHANADGAESIAGDRGGSDAARVADHRHIAHGRRLGNRADAGLAIGRQRAAVVDAGVAVKHLRPGTVRDRGGGIGHDIAGVRDHRIAAYLVRIGIQAGRGVGAGRHGDAAGVVDAGR